MSGEDEVSIERAAAVIRGADALLISAGAGMGVDSGLPDFRGREGFWRAYPALARLGLSFEEMADPGWFRRDPSLAWAFYGHRLNLYRSTHPHSGFAQLLALAQGMKAGWFVFTSNVDGQFQRAGFDPDRLVECHGSIHHFQCVAGCGQNIWSADDERVVVDESAFRAVEPWPRCPYCDGLARPNVLMFGDGSWLGARTGEQQERFRQWLAGLARTRARLVVIELGAGSTIATVRHTSETVARRLGGRLIRINPREPDVPTGEIGLALGAANGVARLLQAPGRPPHEADHPDDAGAGLSGRRDG